MSKYNLLVCNIFLILIIFCQSSKAHGGDNDVSITGIIKGLGETIGYFGLNTGKVAVEGTYDTVKAGGNGLWETVKTEGSDLKNMGMELWTHGNWQSKEHQYKFNDQGYGGHFGENNGRGGGGGDGGQYNNGGGGQYNGGGGGQYNGGGGQYNGGGGGQYNGGGGGQYNGDGGGQYRREQDYDEQRQSQGWNDRR